MQDDKKAHQITLQELGIIPKEPKRKEEVRKQYAFPCGGCVCSHCANNVETPDTCTGEMKEPCFTCDYCKHYDGKGTDRRLQDCDKYIVTDEHARRLRRHIKIINRRNAHQAPNGALWYYIYIDGAKGKKYGYVNARYITAK